MMFTPLAGQIITALAVVACIGSLLGWQFTNAQVSKAAAWQSDLYGGDSRQPSGNLRWINTTSSDGDSGSLLNTP
ncbi:hypothetical protein [Tatumella sp. UBA2305]|uniref:hypothetical protein n=1 Tax=Tatumella sp. UBA2305 TaxID=1947647 RepID=UPI0025F780F3|nr:hypothetical protein [Tatumella sp. UBA2305]